ncbi:hypothetical protein L226DRAFT_292528 [Lentinus tigrinus ALCF2SS1-7]|uniref:uncharacterized protein n=1 Tax=Lentinus tigrinus ALCF2SS1-7 TaxID=1328758 RepID=UPI0011660385|nr:hypothetical protein L226DRAFT_292528 [Lentinus tigrinus ALCF2SS1-7]
MARLTECLTESILRERRSMEKTNETAADGLLSLEQKLARAQASIATLQAQHSADKQAMELMANDIAEVLAIQEDMGCRLQRLSESHQSISDKADHTRNLLTELPHDIFNMSSHSERRLVADQHVVDAPGFTLADELAAAATPNPRLPSDSDLLTSSSESEPQNGETASQHAAELAAVGGDATFLDVDELAAVSDNASLPPFVDEFDACKSSANSVSSSSVANSSPDAASSPRVLWTHLSSIAGVVSDDDTVSTVRLCVAYVTSVVWSAGTTEWFEVVKAKAGLQKLHEKFTIYSHGASVRWISRCLS